MPSDGEDELEDEGDAGEVERHRGEGGHFYLLNMAHSHWSDHVLYLIE